MAGGQGAKRSVVIGLIFMGLAIGIVAWAYMHQRTTGRTSAPLEQTEHAAKKSDAPPTSYIERPGEPADRILQEQARTDQGKVAAENPVGGKVDQRFDYGKLPSVKGDANPQVRSVAEALRDKNHPERLSPLIQPKFDFEAFKKDPAGYVSVVEPGRCFVTAQPSPSTPRLWPLSPQLQTVKQGERVKLRVKTAPNGVASLTAFDGGAFSENGLNAVSVLADSEGIAEATFVATPGAVHEAKVLVGSAMASGQIQFIVNIESP